MKVVKYQTKDKIEHRLVVDVYQRPYIEYVNAMDDQNDKFFLFRSTEQLSYNALQELYEMIYADFYQDQFLEIFPHARDLIVFAYYNNLTELSMHILYVLQQYYDNIFIDYLLKYISKDAILTNILTEISKKMVIYEQAAK